MPGPPRWKLAMTTGRRAPAIQEMASLLSEMPQLEDEVMDLTPAAAAPKAMLEEATSLSPWMKMPPTCGIRRAKYSGTSF